MIFFFQKKKYILNSMIVKLAEILHGIYDLRMAYQILNNHYTQCVF